MHKLNFNNFNQERQIGEHTIYLPDPPNLSQIANHRMSQENQMWRRPDIPKNYEYLTRKEKFEIAKREWDRRINGYWFYNNGNIEYMTGLNYFYCAHWWLDGMYPLFIDSDRDYWYVWDKAENDDNCVGLIYIADRREGKTYKANAILYNRISTAEEKVGTIQSKTDSDAGIVFAKLINSWRRLPSFFKPTDEGISLPKSALRFFEPSRKNTKDKKKIYEPALDSYIDYLPAVEVAADGMALRAYIGDEIGKTVRADVDARWKVVRECMMKGSEIVGKAILTTTVEEMEAGGGANCKAIWDKSDQTKLDPLGRTQSGLIRYFKPADYGLKGIHPVTKKPFIDQYGYSDRVAMREFIMAKRSNLEGEDLKSEKRKYPLSEKEAFQATEGDCVFNAEILHARKDKLTEKTLTRRVNFTRDDETGLVKWVDAPLNGRWWISWDFDHPNESNRIIEVKGKIKPNNNVNFSAGADPFAHTVITGKGSMACAYVIRHFDENDPENSGKPVCRYSARPALKSLVAYDWVLMCEYYGCLINIENNYDDWVEDFIDLDREKFLMKRPKITMSPTMAKPKKDVYGTPSKNGFTNVRHLKALSEYIENHGEKIDFMELIDDCIDYDPLNRTPFDDAVAFGMALLAVLENTVTKKGQEKTKTKAIKVLKQYVISSGM